ncbi:DUF3192 domain-containing protein [Pseudidiomarina mangrovi]|uniref:DUF3192 domain-containing protein n=1 Tax=Pseudidiomarina mangrovi TaxID=2487133 RepID=UPI000FCB530A|nr:DUF3192 domain-containing protein [Pseudidiomarina mangrovi]CAI8152866.1 MAG: Uncharacterised protein [Pseudidiomarina mangrovi]
MKASQLAALSLVVVLGMGLQGCVIAVGGEGYDSYDSSSDYRNTEKRNRQYIASLTEGTTLAAVEAELGAPNFSDLVTVDGVRYRVMYYRTHRVQADGNTTRDECTPVVFADGLMIGTGDLALARVPSLN